MKLCSWPEIGSDGDVLLTPYVPKGITGYDDDDDDDVTVVMLESWVASCAHTACHQTLQHHNSYNRTENHTQ